MSRWRRCGSWWKTAAIVLAGLCLAGCSALRLAYNQGPELLYWWADGYLDFERGQSPQVRGALHDWFAWHRRTQLPVYGRLLARTRAELAADTTPERVCQVVDEARALARTAMEEGVPRAAALLPQLQPAQIAHLERHFRKHDDEWQRDYLQPDLAERAAAAVERTLKPAQTLYGRLDDAQRQALTQAVPATGFDPLTWRTELLARREHLVRRLRALQAEPGTAAQREAALRELVAEAFDSPRPAYRAYAERVRAGQCRLAAQLHNQTTLAQRRHAMDKLKGWEDDLRALVAAAPPAPAVTSQATSTP